MKKLLLSFALLLCFLFSKNTEAQIDSFFSQNVAQYDSAGLFYFYPNKIEPGDLFSTYHYYFFQDSVNSMDTVKIWVDSLLHYTHYKYQQTYKGIKIEGAEFIEHAYLGYTQYAYGKIALFADEVFSPDSLSDSSAFDSLSKYLNYFAGHIPAWTDSTWERDYRINMGDSAAKYYPKGELVWALDSFNGLGFMIPRSRYRLAWRYEIIYAGDSGYNKAIYVDAYSGEVFREMNLGNSNGPAITTYNGTRTIDTHHRGWPQSDNILQTDDAGRNIHTKNWSSSPWFIVSNMTSVSDNWGTSKWQGTDVHWMASEAWDYYSSVHGRNGMNDHGSVVRIHVSTPFGGASFDHSHGNSNLYFGVVNGKYLGTLDIVGHEYMHGITYQTSQLVYLDEPGALDESFSDIMGITLKRHVAGGNNWIIGDDLGTTVDPSYCRRSLQAPKTLGNHTASDAGQPNTYKGQFWCIDPDFDNGGVHVNEGVQNYWFFLLSQGGTGTNDNGDAYSITGIGNDAATLIAYNTNVNHLISSSQFTDSRANSIAVATAIYGSCSNEEIQTQNAWAAVGVGTRSICANAAIHNVNELAANKPRLFPNPANNSFNIYFNTEQSYNITIFASDGKLVKSFKNINNNNSNVATDDMPAGFYYINIWNDKGNTCLKLIKQ